MTLPRTNDCGKKDVEDNIGRASYTVYTKTKTFRCHTIDLIEQLPKIDLCHGFDIKIPLITA